MPPVTRSQRRHHANGSSVPQPEVLFPDSNEFLEKILSGRKRKRQPSLTDDNTKRKRRSIVQQHVETSAVSESTALHTIAKNNPAEQTAPRVKRNAKMPKASKKGKEPMRREGKTGRKKRRGIAHSKWEPFEKHLSRTEYQEALNSGTLLCGVLHVNSRRPDVGYVTVAEHSNDFLIKDRHDRNRALDGDEVVIQLLKEKEIVRWEPTESADASDVIEPAGHERIIELNSPVHSKFRTLQKEKAKVVAIRTRNNNVFAGIWMASKHDGGSGALVPNDIRAPLLQVRKSVVPLKEHELYMVAFKSLCFN